MTLALPAQTTPPAVVARVSVKDTGGLNAALKSAKPGEIILLAPGVYSGLSANGLALKDVTITSADPAHPATLAPFYMNGASGLTFSNLVFTVEGSKDPYPTRIGNCSNITITQVSVHGSMDGNPQNDPSGLSIDGSDHITVTKSDFQELANGLVHRNSTNVLVDGNHFHDIGQDGVHGAGSSNMTVSNNRFSDFKPEDGQHPDAVQFFTAGTKQQAHDIVATGNLYERGSGSTIQGMFFSDESGMGYKAVTISNNVIVGGLYNGVGMANGDGVTITGNTILAYPDQESWIVLRYSRNVTATGNRAEKFTWLETKVVEKGDKTNDETRDKGAKAIAAWTAEHPGATYGVVVPSAGH
jgi:parallel beta-helix repeat protein